MVTSLKTFAARRPVLTSALLWMLSIAITLLCFMYQDKTGPTYPLEGDIQTAKGTVRFKFLRSETIGTGLKIILPDPVPEGVSGFIEYRRYKSNDDWAVVSMRRGTFGFSRRGRAFTAEGVGAELPSLKERAGKYEYFVYIDDGVGEPVSVTGQSPIQARYKGAVPRWALMMHITVIFASMAIAARTTLEALADGAYRWMLWATLASLLLGGFVLGPIVQWYAFGVWWAGVPYGYDWTDNKVLVELAFWVPAVCLNAGKRRARWPVYLAFAMTFFVYFIPHSVLGSEYDYRTGTGRGTIG